MDHRGCAVCSLVAGPVTSDDAATVCWPAAGADGAAGGEDRPGDPRDGYTAHPLPAPPAAGPGHLQGDGRHPTAPSVSPQPCMTNHVVFTVIVYLSCVHNLSHTRTLCGQCEHTAFPRSVSCWV